MLRLALCGLAVVVAMCTGIAQAASVQYVYDGLGRLVAAIDPSGDTVLYTYDPAGNIISVSRSSSSQLAIIAFQPARGKVGDVVTVIGSAFIPDPTQNIVSFAGTPAPVQAATATALTVTVPAGAVTGPIIVSNANGLVTSSQSFVVVDPPIVSAISPAFFARATSTDAEISGNNLADVISVEFTQPGLSASIQPGATLTRLPIRLVVSPTVPLGDYEFSLRNNVGEVVLSGAVRAAVTAAPLGTAVSASRTVSVHLPAVVGGVPSGNSMSASGTVSVHLPAVVGGVPPGNAMSASGTVSVHMPTAAGGVPPGNAMSASRTASVHLPAAAAGVPAGNAMSVTQPASVSMP